MAIHVQLTLADEKGKNSTVFVPLPTGVDAADALYFAEALIPLIEPLVTGTLRDAKVSLDVPFAGWVPIGTVADVEEKGKFFFRTASNFLKRISLPTFNELKFQPGSKLINLADLDVAAFVTAITDGIDVTGLGGSGVISPSDTRNGDITNIDFASETWG